MKAVKRGEAQKIIRRWQATALPAAMPWLVGIVIAVAVGAIAWKLIEPPPSKIIRFAAGRPGGAYYRFAEQYRERMRRHGFEVQVVETAGALENQKLLAAGKVDVAFLQGGAEALAPDPEGRVTALASVYYEPLWVFRRVSENAPTRLSELIRKPIAIGEPGSGTQVVARHLFALNGITDNPNLIEIGGAKAVAALKDGTIDAAFMIMAPQSPTLKSLLEAPGVELMNFRRHRAYSRNLNFIRDIQVPEGMLDLKLNLPEEEITVLTTVAQLAAQKDLHPGIVQLLLTEGAEMFGGRGLLEDPGEFPSRKYLALPLHAGAEDWFIGGPSFLSRYLPFDAVIAVKRLGLLLLPILTILLPLFKIAPMIYSWQMRRRIFRWYVDLVAIERELGDNADWQAAANDLSILEKDVRAVVEVPASYRRDYYLLRTHIDYVRRQLNERAVVMLSETGEKAAAAAAQPGPQGA